MIHRQSIAAALLLTLSACAAQGDFGRPKPSMWDRTVLPLAGTLSATLRSEPVSRFAQTDDEEELRARAWRFLMPAHERDMFNRVLSDLRRQRILPYPDASGSYGTAPSNVQRSPLIIKDAERPGFRSSMPRLASAATITSVSEGDDADFFEECRQVLKLAGLHLYGVCAVDDVSAYHAALMNEAFRSPASRYTHLAEDIAADSALIAPFEAIAARVVSADAVRLKALGHIPQISELERDYAMGRIGENRLIIAWVHQALIRRLASYRYALEHLVIEAPQAEAIAPERQLSMLERSMGQMERLKLKPLVR